MCNFGTDGDAQLQLTAKGIGSQLELLSWLKEVMCRNRGGSCPACVGRNQFTDLSGDQILLPLVGSFVKQMVLHSFFNHGRLVVVGALM